MSLAFLDFLVLPFGSSTQKTSFTLLCYTHAMTYVYSQTAGGVSDCRADLTLAGSWCHHCLHCRGIPMGLGCTSMERIWKNKITQRLAVLSCLFLKRAPLWSLSVLRSLSVIGVGLVQCGEEIKRISSPSIQYIHTLSSLIFLLLLTFQGPQITVVCVLHPSSGLCPASCYD
jgi:hypothetical protein